MNLLSTDNSFYRYNISEINDLSELTYARRKQKSIQNCKKSFYFDINITSKYLEQVANFLSNKIAASDCVSLRINNIENIISLGVPANQIIIKISNLIDFNNLTHPELKLSLSVKNLLFAPENSLELKIFNNYYINNQNKFNYFWIFSPYKPNLKNSITVADIASYSTQFNTIHGLEIINTNIPTNYELEPESTSYKIDWSFNLKGSSPEISVIIPSYNNSLFLSNVIWHLLNQNLEKSNYEIVIADDGSTDNSSQLLHEVLFHFKDLANITYIYWSKEHPLRSSQNFFRSGLARNLACHHSVGDLLLFLDSDMLVPDNFLETCIEALKNNDLIQFQRFHINQELSKTNPNYNAINISKHTYIEEKSYWSELFFSDNWCELPNYWKYTCTYALGISKANFKKMGLFKKYYISYGFEDTDLGYEAFKAGLKFSLIKLPLLHLTAYNQMQYKNSFTNRFKLLRKTSELFFLQHLDKQIYNLLGNYYRAQKPIKSFIRDLFN